MRMMSRVIAVTVVGLLVAGVCMAQTPKDASVLKKHLSLDQWLSQKGLSRSDVELRQKDRRDVFDPVTESYDGSMVVYEVWKKKQTIPAEPLYYADGTQAMIVKEVGKKTITRTEYETQQVEQESLVKAETKYEKKPVERTRYLVKGR